MAGKNRRQALGRKLDSAKRKRSYEVPLLWLGAAAFIGFPMLRDATSDPMRRNRYMDRYSCECDYDSSRCNYDGGSWVGPWYADRASDRKPDDPGHGQCRSGGGGRYGYYGGGGGGNSEYRPPTGVEKGYRGGFGGTAHVRAAGS
jgi:hypothetical protein